MSNRMLPTRPDDRIWGPVKIAGTYLLIGVLWILFSDKAASRLASNEAILAQISLYKGWGYVLVTSLLLYWLIQRHTAKLTNAEHTLRESEKKYQQLLDQASDGIFIADPGGRYILVNKEASKLVGYTKEELLSMNLRDLVAPEDLEITPLRLDELRSGKTLITERKLLRKDKSPIMCEISGKILPDGSFQSIVRDITERKVIEEALKRSEKRYRSLFENMSNGYARCQMLYDDGKPLDFVFLDVNNAFKNLTGMQDVIGRRVTEMIPGIRESNPEAFDIYGRVAMTGKSEKFEAFVPGLESGIWFSVSAYSPEKEFFVSVFENITERKQAENALRESEERLRLSLYAANQGLYDLNIQTGNAVVNREYAEMLGYDPDTFVETNSAWIERLHPDDREITSKAYSEYISGLTPEYRVEFRQRTKDGNWKWILSLGKIVEYGTDGKPIRMLGTHTDITERKRAEEALRQSEDNFARAFNSNPAALAITRIDDGTFLILNEAYTKIMGYEPPEILGRTVADLNIYINPDERNMLVRQLREQDRMRDYELLVRSKSGDVRSLLVSMEPILYDNGPCILSTFLDITERKQAEEKIRSLNEDLEARVIERTSQLEAANKELESFSYSISHDLRAPLRAIDGYTNILVEDYEAVLDVEGKRICGVISRETQRMGKLIDDLLAFSRVGRREVHPQKIDMKAIVDSVFAELLRNEDKSRFDIQVGSLIPVNGDTALMRQVWVNLLSNAIKFTSRKKRAVIEVQSWQEDGEIVYSVRDNGAGFDMEYVNKLFGVFQRLHGEDEFEGTGVGLAIVQRVIHRHDGRVWAEGKVDEGAVFHFALPEKEIEND